MKFVNGLLIAWCGLIIGAIGTFVGILYKFGEAHAMGNYTYPNTIMILGKRLYKRIMK